MPHIMWHFIWVFTVFKSTCLGVSRIQRVNKYTADISKFHTYLLLKNSNLNQLVGILTFINKIKTTVVSFKTKNIVVFQHRYFYEPLKENEKKF